MQVLCSEKNFGECNKVFDLGQQNYSVFKRFSHEDTEIKSNSYYFCFCYLGKRSWKNRYTQRLTS